MRALASLLALLALTGPASADPARWSGLTIGAGIGAGRMATGASGSTIRMESLRIGYLRPFGGVLFGGEIAYDRLSVATIADDDNHYTRFQVVAGADLGRWMPYAKAGVASLTFRGDGARQSDVGTLFGLGVAYALTPRTALRAEVVHVDSRQFDHGPEDRSATFLDVSVLLKF